MKITTAQYNVLFRNSWPTIAGDLIAIIESAPVSVLTLNECDPVRHPAVVRFMKETGWKQGAFWESDRILFDPTVWKRTTFRGHVPIARSASDYGFPNLKFHPTRDLVWQGLQHRETGDKHLFYVTHWPRGYAKPEAKPPTTENRYANMAARAASKNTNATVEVHLKRRRQFKFHHLHGDFNARQNNRAEDYYPARTMEKFWVPDTMPNSIDWMMHSKRSEENGLKVKNRWTLGDRAGMDSDHLAHLKTMEF